MMAENGKNGTAAAKIWRILRQGIGRERDGDGGQKWYQTLVYPSSHQEGIRVSGQGSGRQRRAPVISFPRRR